MSATGAAPVAGRDLRLRWYIVGLLAIGVMISFVDRTSISAALAVPAFVKHFGLTNVGRGWVNSAFFWSYALLQVPLGWVVDRYGVKWPYAICFGLWCLATASIGLVSTLWALILLRLLVGAAEAVVVPASWRWMRTHFEEKQSGTAVGIFMFGTKIGPALGAPLAAWLIAHADWRAMFFILGTAGLVWLVPWLAVVRDDGRKAEREQEREPSLTARQLLSSPLIWGTIVVNFSYNYFNFYCMTWMPSFLVEQRGLSLGQMGLYTFFSFAGIAIVAMVAGWAADRLIARGHDAVLVRKSFTIAGFVIASTIIFSVYATSLDVALFCNVASLSGLGLATANYNALCRLTLIPSSTVGLVTGIQQVATALAGIVAPLATGWLLEITGNYNLAIQTILLFLAIGALTTAFVLRRKYSLRPEDQPA